MKTEINTDKIILKWISVVIFIMLIICQSRLAFAITTAGTLPGDETWSGSVAITGNVIVPVGITLTVSPGTLVEFNAGEGLQLLVDGTLIAEGTEAANITFTSDSGTPDKGDWTWIRFSSTGGGSIIYCRIQYANTGVRIRGSSPVVSESIFSNNHYGISSTDSSSVIQDNIFTDNGYGISFNNSSSTIKNNRFSNNSNDAIDVHSSSSDISIQNNIIFNTGAHGIEIEYTSSPLVENNTLYNNSKSGLYVKYFSSPTIKNNLVTDGADHGILTRDSSSPAILYNDVWNNPSGNYYDHDTAASFSPTPGFGDLSGDPMYEDTLNDDFHLAFGSPAIDAGDPASDYSNEPEPNGDRINMGAYGNTLEATINDMDGDGLVDSWELAYFGNLDQVGTGDPDRDGLDNEGEETAQTDPTVSDTDDDGYSDGEEVEAGSDPNDPNSIPNQVPVADASGPYIGVEGQAIILDGSASVDVGGTIELYEWDIDNDGTFEYITSLPTQSHTYALEGIYTIRLKVTDDFGTSDEATTTATVSDALPTADFTGSPTNGITPLTVNFTDNSRGYDQPLSYEWDFDNNGTTDSTGRYPAYTYNTAGIYTVNLTVTDSDGSVNSLARTDYISACLSPVRIGGATPLYFSTLQAAYDAAVDGDIIQSRAVSLAGDLDLNRNISVTLQGGYNCDYTTITGTTTLNGTLTDSDGTAGIGGFVIK